MNRRATLVVFVALAILTGAAAARGQTPTTAPADLDTVIATLGSFDFQARTSAARAIRRAAGAAVPALDRAVRSHRDEYVRYRALVLVSGLDESAAAPLMRDMTRDRNDRLRTAAYSWFEHHPEPGMLPALVAALPDERSEFVRPALTRAIAAYGTDSRARAVILPLIVRGDDLFRGAVIDAIGDYGGADAVPALIEVAKLEGPLQDDAVTALGKIGDARARPALAAIQPKAPADVQPTIAAAFCLLGMDCQPTEAFLKKTLAFAAQGGNDPALLRGVVHALGMLSIRGQAWALTALLDAGTPASDPSRETIALGVGNVALRRPELVLDAVMARPDAASAAALLQDAFDMLSEDFEEERFCSALLRAFWAAEAGSTRRRAAEALIETLEF